MKHIKRKKPLPMGHWGKKIIRAKLIECEFGKGHKKNICFATKFNLPKRQSEYVIEGINAIEIDNATKSFYDKDTAFSKCGRGKIIIDRDAILSEREKKSFPFQKRIKIDKKYWNKDIKFVCKK